MSSIGGSSSNATNKGKGKEVVVDEAPVPPPVAEEKQQLVAAAEESDDGYYDSDSYWETDWYPESDSSEQEKEQLKGEGRRSWLDTLMRTKFWDPCKEHGSKNRADQCMFCLKCFKVTCPRCTHSKPGHRLLKIRRYVYRSVVHASDLQDLGVDVSRVQTYVINAKKVLHLRPMNRSKHFRPQAGTPRCITCRTWLRSSPNLYCSLVCEENAGVSQDDFSGPEAELRYRSLQAHMANEPPVAAEELPDSEAEPEIPAQVVEPPPPPPPPPAPAAPQNASFRRRRRKQAAPARAPFF